MEQAGNLLAVLRYGLNVIRNLSRDSCVRLIFISVNNINVVVAGVGHQGSFTKPKSYLRIFFFYTVLCRNCLGLPRKKVDLVGRTGQRASYRDEPKKPS